MIRKALKEKAKAQKKQKNLSFTIIYTKNTLNVLAIA